MPSRRTWFKLAACLVSILVTLLIIEAALGISGLAVKDNMQFIPGRGGAYIPHARYRHSSEGFSEGRFNSHGFRDYERELAKPAGTYRIAIFGDSFVEALQVDLAKSFPTLVERHFDEAHPELDVEVLAFGQSGSGTTDSLLRYLHTGAAFSPDLVVLAFLTRNDFRDNHPKLSPGDVRPFFLVGDGGRLVLDTSRLDAYQASRTWPKRALRAARRHSCLLTMASKYLFLKRRTAEHEAFVAAGGEQVGALPAKTGAAPISRNDDLNVFLTDPAPAWDEAFDVTARIIEKFQEEVEARGARFVIVSLSNSLQVHPERQAQLEATHGARFDWDRPDRFIGATALALGVPYLELYPLLLQHHLDTGEYIHGFDGSIGGHWNEVGHRVAAQRLYEFLEPLVVDEENARGD